MSRRFQLARNIVLLLVSSLFAALLFEAALQLFPGVLPERHRYMAERVANQNRRAVLDLVHRDEPHIHHHPSDTFQYHPTLGWTSTPNLSRSIWGYDGFFEIETNSLGFRDRDPERTGSNPRVLVLGDSFVWGLFLDQDQLMPQQLEVALNASGQLADVHNFGMAGYGNDQELLVLREFGRSVRPSVVILAFFYSNDFEDNNRKTSRWRGGRAKPYFTLDGNDTLELHNVPVPEPDLSTSSAQPRKPDAAKPSFSSQLRKRTVLANLMRAAWRTAGGNASKPKRAAAGDAREAIEPGARITRAILLEIEREASRQHAELVVALFPGYGYSAGRRGEYLRAAEFFRRELPGVDLVDLTEAFDRSDRPLHGRYVEHWNADGAKLAAQVLAEHLIRHHAAALQTD